MELEKHPETEYEYWAAIDALGSFIASTRRGVYRGHLPTQALKQLESASKLSQKLVAEIEVKFGILFRPELTIQEPEGGYPTPPEGKRWYWSWYHQMRKDWLAEEFNKLICSACPLSGGVEKFDREIPCEPFSAMGGSMFQLTQPHVCGLISFREWTREELLAKIHAKGGEEAVVAFTEKERKLLEIAKTEAVSQTA